MSKRKYNKHDKTAPILYALLSLHAVGRDNAKQASFFVNELRARGVKMHPESVRRILREHPRAGVIDGTIKGGYYLITTANEARQTIAGLMHRANEITKRADALKAYFNIED